MATACIAASIDTDDLHLIYEGSDIAWCARSGSSEYNPRAFGLVAGTITTLIQSCYYVRTIEKQIQYDVMTKNRQELTVHL